MKPFAKHSLGRRKPALLVSIALILSGSATAIRGQSALDGFDPNANGSVRAVVVQPDGKILMGGDFTSLAPNGGISVTRNHIARLNPDGTLDNTFDPNANSVVNTIALQSDGKVLVGGAFSAIGGGPRHNIARLDPNTGLTDSFDPNANGPIFCIALQSDGKILVGGFFANVGGQPRNNIARLDPATGLADSFNPNANDGVRAILLQSDERILVGGAFLGPNSIGGQSRNCIARLDPATGLADSFNPNASDVVVSIALQPDGKILIGGGFYSALGTTGGQLRDHIARLDPVTGLADSFNPGTNDIVNTIAVQADGMILAGGSFITMGGQSHKSIARFDPALGQMDSSFGPNATGGFSAAVNAIAVQSDGKILAGGDFTEISGVTRNRIVRLESNGRLDQTLNVMIFDAVDRYVHAIAVQPDGRILIAGVFTTVSQFSRFDIARLHADGALDLVFNPNVVGPVRPSVQCIAVQPDGKILIGGSFTNVGGFTRNGIVRLNEDGALDVGFNPNPNGRVVAIAQQPNGKILVGGEFTHIGGQFRSYIARLDGTTGLADSFNPNANNVVTSVAVQADGNILAGGSFSGIGGQSRNFIARLDGVTGLASAFNPNPNDVVTGVTVQPDGKVLASGNFFTIGGQGRTHLARLDGATALADSFNPNPNGAVASMSLQADGKIVAAGFFSHFSGTPSIGGLTRDWIARLDSVDGLADSFDANPSASGFLFSIATQPDGKILTGSQLSTIGGEARTGFARLSNDIAALQQLAVTKSAITWTLGGSSPQFTHVTFEYADHTPLGEGTPSGNNWILTGLNLPTGQNLYVRARGYYRSGQSDSCESIAESVRNVFLRPEVTLVSAASRKFHGATPFDINLPLSGGPAVECRSGGANGDFQLVFTFSNTLVGVGAASLTSGTGSVSSRAIGADAHHYIVNLTGMTNAQRVTVSLTNVYDSTGNHSDSVPISVGMLLGDTTGNGSVNATDISQTKLRSGQTVDASNFRTDVTVSNSINASDVSLVKLKSGTALPVASQAEEIP
jgi:uncharacterized delta-60 repeat protein